jgi:hypothetical protein
MEAQLPSWRIPGHDSTRFPWRAPGDVDRALPGAAARRLYLPGALHESCRKGDVDDVRARLDAGASVDELDGVRVQLPERGRGRPRRGLGVGNLKRHSPAHRATTRRSTSQPGTTSLLW